MRILTMLDGSASDAKAATVAVTLTKRLGAQLEGLFIKIDSSEVISRMGEGVSPTIIQDVMTEAFKYADECAAKARGAMAKAAGDAALFVSETPIAHPGPGAMFEIVQGPRLEVLTTKALLADLIIFGEPGREPPASLMAKIGHASLQLRRPVLLAAGHVSATIGERILVPFNGSLESGNALLRSLPILAKAGTIEILHLCENEQQAGIGAQAVRYLAQHGIKARVTEKPADNKAIGPLVEKYARSSEADLVVMGGYGRSRLRELILGGATRHMLHHAPVPVALVH